ncbi:hypothetical protein SeMB42_g02937 [Synchytrium endobioticum]|uniref:Uncharacterized protein n=1 Tax=Synchytrium endobioticum TaxID=286115 RepID=A0A507DB58_9FUNG|nr:hypothetical protein SeMB42_g02937 [Synchytrium endobioticum]
MFQPRPACERVHSRIVNTNFPSALLNTYISRGSESGVDANKGVPKAASISRCWDDQCQTLITICRRSNHSMEVLLDH